MLTAFLAVTGIVALLTIQPENFGKNLMLFIAVLPIGYFFYRFAGLGAGDAKLFAVSFLWLGIENAIQFLFYFGVFSGGIVIFLIIARRAPLTRSSSLKNWKPLQKSAPVPLALAISPAAIIATPLVQSIT